jgi:hypothetical protein
MQKVAEYRRNNGFAAVGAVIPRTLHSVAMSINMLVDGEWRREVRQSRNESGELVMDEANREVLRHIGLVNGAVYLDRKKSFKESTIDDLDTKVQSTTTHYAAEYDGADADARLDAALNAATDGDEIILEAATYSDDRSGSSSIDKTLHLRGRGQQASNGPVIDNDWDIAGTRGGISEVMINPTNTVTISAGRGYAFNINLGGTLSFSNNECIAWGITNSGTVEYQSGTSNGEAGVLAGSLTTTDSGSNVFLT